jgi:hypothetical protein
MGRLSRYLLVALVAFAAAFGAVWIAREIGEPRHPSGGELHALMHDKLTLDPAQTARVETLERAFAETRKGLDAQLRQANAELAAAIANEHQYGPKVAEAVDRSHQAMGALQKATLSHVFAMRAVLRPDQTGTFDAAVGKALTRSDDE